MNCRCGKLEHNVREEEDYGVSFVGKILDMTHSLDTVNDLFHRMPKNLRDYRNTSVHCFVIILFTDTYTLILRYDMKSFDQKHKSYKLIFDKM